MNDYEKLMQAAEFVRKYLEEHCGLNVEIRISATAWMFCAASSASRSAGRYRTKKMNSRNSPAGLSCGG